ncbi:hypothetical protein CDEST_00046 [Colletotrichum destructivum]|uniref:Uncharacterized protein n=1 Tax=Colletotrichum destructivum TaxID=34406 RepID=A0AAX4HW93_9PEZI|nr:hypothetical protein CDEST_00046 [Colletotrichum destructivum]
MGLPSDSARRRRTVAAGVFHGHGAPGAVPVPVPRRPGTGRRSRVPMVVEHCSSRILSVLGGKALAIHAIKDSHLDGNRTHVAGVWLRNIKVSAPAVWRHPLTPFAIDRFRRHTTAAAPPRSPPGPGCRLTAVPASTLARTLTPLPCCSTASWS